MMVLGLWMSITFDNLLLEVFSCVDIAVWLWRIDHTVTIVIFCLLAWKTRKNGLVDDLGRISVLSHFVHCFFFCSVIFPPGRPLRLGLEEPRWVFHDHSMFLGLGLVLRNHSMFLGLGPVLLDHSMCLGLGSWEKCEEFVLRSGSSAAQSHNVSHWHSQRQCASHCVHCVLRQTCLQYWHSGLCTTVPSPSLS